MDTIAYPLTTLQASKGKPTTPVRVSVTRRVAWLGGFVPIRYFVRASLLWATQHPEQVFDGVKAMRFGDELYWLPDARSWVVQVDEDLWQRVGFEVAGVPSAAMRSWTKGQLLAFVIQSLPIEALANVPLKVGVEQAPSLLTCMRGPSTVVGAAPSPIPSQRTVVGAAPSPKIISELEHAGASLPTGEWVVPRLGSNPNP